MEPTQNNERFVPKVHPLARAVDPEDPMTLNATWVPGDPDVMLRCVIQEYARMGWDAEAILSLFRDPLYPALHALRSWYGEPRLCERLASELSRSGVLRFAATVHDDVERIVDDHADEPALVQIDIPGRSAGSAPGGAGACAGDAPSIPVLPAR